MEPIIIKSYIQVNNIAILKWSLIRNSTENDVEMRTNTVRDFAIRTDKLLHSPTCNMISENCDNLKATDTRSVQAMLHEQSDQVRP